MKTNENVTIEITGNKLTVKQLCFPTYTFEVKEKAPAGYHIWNIGHNMPAEYTPYCKYLHDLNIDPTSLVAVLK
jgi:hypothetical protein